MSELSKDLEGDEILYVRKSKMRELISEIERLKESNGDLLDFLSICTFNKLKASEIGEIIKNMPDKIKEQAQQIEELQLSSGKDKDKLLETLSTNIVLLNRIKELEKLVAKSREQ